MASTLCSCITELDRDDDGWSVREVLYADPDCRATHAVVVES